MPTIQSTPWWSESSASTMLARAEINDASVPARTPHSMTASLRRALDTRVLVASLFLLALAIFVGILVPAFYRESNVFILLRQTAMLGIVALGETLVLIVGGIDLSVTCGHRPSSRDYWANEPVRNRRCAPVNTHGRGVRHVRRSGQRHACDIA